MGKRRGRRNKRARARRLVNRIVSRNSHLDRVRSESVNILTPMQIYGLASMEIRSVDPELVLVFDKGEIISDSRGLGTLQGVT